MTASKVSEDGMPYAMVFNEFVWGELVDVHPELLQIDRFKYTKKASSVSMTKTNE